jgi:hypothetical protein
MEHRDRGLTSMATVSRLIISAGNILFFVLGSPLRSAVAPLRRSLIDILAAERKGGAAARPWLLNSGASNAMVVVAQ